MGTLIDPRTGELVVLRAEHVFGRNPLRADTLLDDPEVSLMHAAARWRNGCWKLFDHSRNGTFVDGRALAPGEGAALVGGQEIRMGRGPGSMWRVLDVSGPVDVLVPKNARRPVLALASHNLLPDSASPELCIYAARPGHWILEQDGETRTLLDGDTVQFGAEGVHCFVAAAPAMDETWVTANVEEVDMPCLILRLSLDEEHARLEIRHGASRTDLGERSHHYCLATLARRRMADQQRGIETGAQGWLGAGDLARMLGMEMTHLNMQIFRVREQLMTALPGVAALARLIERRRGELRIGDVPFEVYRGDRMEGHYRHGSIG
jgi:hypothetical protein